MVFNLVILTVHTGLWTAVVAIVVFSVVCVTECLPLSPELSLYQIFGWMAYRHLIVGLVP